MQNFKAWSFKTLTRTANGIQHYADVPEACYVYDNNVKNSRHVKVHDLVVIQDDEYVLGAGWIDSIDASSQEKIRYRCRHCRETDIKERSKKKPTYWCSSCHTAFETPVEELLSVEKYTANYSRTFEWSERPFPVETLEPAFVAHAKQNAIRELTISVLRPLLDKDFGVSGPWWHARATEDENIAGGFTSGMRKTRIGQQRFRGALLARHGELCAFTGPQPPAALEAAHLVPYSQNAEHDIKGGLLLRRDLHVLFDRHLITIDPDTWSIHVAPKLMRYPDLAVLDGQPVLVKACLRPPRILVEGHANAARDSWD